MKRIYLTLGLIASLTSGAFAQKVVDLEITSLNPVSHATYPNFNTGDTFQYAFVITNNGTANVDVTDTLTGYVELGFLGLSDLGAYLPLGFPDGYSLASGDSDTLSWSVIQGVTTIGGATVAIPSNTMISTFLAVTGVDANGDPFDDAGVDAENIGGNNFDGIDSVTIGTVGILNLDHVAHSTLNVYPNPVSNGTIHFQYEFASAAQAIARVTDISGRIVMTKDFGKVSGAQSFSLNISALNAGLYMIELTTDQGKAVSKFSVQK